MRLFFFFSSSFSWQVEFKSGEMCHLDLEAMWSPTKKVSDIAGLILNLLSNPGGAEGSVEAEAARQLKEDVKEFEKRASSASSKLG